MKKFAYLSVRVLSVLMFIGGIVLCFLFSLNEWSAKIDHLYSDAVMWKYLFYGAICMTINSIPVLGFSYIIEAACKYLNSCKKEK